MPAPGNQDQARTLHAAQINKVLGSFLLFFALVVLVSTFFTDTAIGKVTNLGAGTVLAAIGGIMLLTGLKAGRTRAGS